MEEDLDSATRYRQRAGELRVIAGGTSDKTSRQFLLDIAEDYERLARSRERIDERDCAAGRIDPSHASARGDASMRTRQ